MSKNYHDEKRYKTEIQVEEILDTLPEFTKTYFAYISDKNYSENTKLQYAYDLKSFFDWLKVQAGFKNQDLKYVNASYIMDKLTKEDLQDYIKTLKYVDGHLSSASYKARKISSLRSFYKYYFTTGDIQRDTASLLAIPNIKNKEVLVLDKDNVNALLNAVESAYGSSYQMQTAIKKTKLRDFAICMLFFGTGLRVSELVGINIKDLNFKENSVRVVRKGGDEDTTYFPDEVKNALLDYIFIERDALLDESKSDALFISLKHERLTQRSVERLIKKYSELAGIGKKVTPHTLRRTYGTNLYEETNDVFLVADALHHASTETAKRYIKMSTENKKRAAKVSSNLFDKK